MRLPHVTMTNGLGEHAECGVVGLHLIILLIVAFRDSKHFLPEKIILPHSASTKRGTLLVSGPLNEHTN